jgi:hypothetical protein
MTAKHSEAFIEQALVSVSKQVDGLFCTFDEGR